MTTGKKAHSSYACVCGGGYTGFDILKWILAIIIVIRHCGQSSGINIPMDGKIFFWFVSVLSPIGVPIFFTITGFLLFRKNLSWYIIKKQLLRIGLLYAVWTVIYLKPIYNAYPYTGMTKSQYIRTLIKDSIFSGTWFHLWYLPSCICAIIIVYFLSKKLNNEKLFILAWILYIIGVFGDGSYAQIVPESWNWFYNIVNKTGYGTRNGLFYGTLFIALGKILADHQDSLKKIKNNHLIIGVCIAFFTLWIELLWIYKAQGPTCNNMVFSAIPMATILVITALRISDNQLLRNINYNILLFFRATSTMIYCIHPLIMQLIGAYWWESHITIWSLKVIEVIVVSIILSGIIWLLSKRIKLFKFLY